MCLLPGYHRSIGETTDDEPRIDDSRLSKSSNNDSAIKGNVYKFHNILPQESFLFVVVLITSKLSSFVQKTAILLRPLSIQEP